MGRKAKLPKFKIVASTKAHGSLDVHVCDMIADKVRNFGLDSKFLGYFKFEKLPNGDIYILKHERRGAYKYVYTPAQTDAEQIIINRDIGKYPIKTKGQLTGHLHSAKGSITYEGVDIINLPAWVLWLPYPRARALMHFYQPDIGGWILLVMKDGRTKWQKWLYQPAIYNGVEDELTMSEEARRRYVDPEDFDVTPHFKDDLKEAAYVVVAISDTHVGEKEAPCPASFMYHEREERPSLTVANKLLNAYWYHFVYMAKYVFKADELWHLGDPVAGTNPFEKYRSPLMTSLPIEASAVAELLNAFNYNEKRLKNLVSENLKAVRKHLKRQKSK